MSSLKSLIGLAICLLSLSRSARSELFPLSIIHINDFHARFEATDTSGGTCDSGEECIGGYARTVHTVRRLLEEQKDFNPVYFNAGDSFQGTLWYNVGRWNVTSQFLNLLPADAMTLGNHEFDHKIEGLVPFLETLQSPMLVANIDSSEEPTMEGLYQKSKIIERSGRKIGVIGVVLETFYDLADTGKLKFLNESDSIIEEAEKLKKQGANIIIVLSHCGYDIDQIIAANAGAEIDVIIGSHSHTFLFTGDVPPGPDRSKGNYPTEVIHKTSGHRVLIVQAAAYAKYVGNITVFFDDNGDVVSYEGAPIYMSRDVKEDATVLEALIPWKEHLDEAGKRVIGETRVKLEKFECAWRECNLGNFYTDAMVYAFIRKTPSEANYWSNVTIALTTQGNFRVPLQKGILTYSHLVTMCPFENKFIALNLHGRALVDVLEVGVAPMNPSLQTPTSSRLLQVSGLRVTYNVTKPVGERVQEVLVRCQECDIPRFEQLDLDKVYRVVVADYLAEGNNGFGVIKENASNAEIGPSDLDALSEFIEVNDPIVATLEGRIKVLK